MLNFLIGSRDESAGKSRILTRKGESGCAVYGPYEERPPGRYLATFTVSLANEFEACGAEEVCAVVDVASDFGANVLGRRDITFRQLLDGSAGVGIEFTLDDDVRTLEYRVYSLGYVPLLIDEVCSVVQMPDIDLQNSHITLERLTRRVEGLRRNIQTLAATWRNNVSIQVNSHDVYNVLKLLEPKTVTSHMKRKIGTKRADGGYVLFDDFGSSGPVYSFGIGANVDFDEELAEMGKPIYMFDHTIDGLPRTHPNFIYTKRGLSPTDEAANQTYSLEYFLRESGHVERSDMILKIDIEGAEWDVLSSIDVEILVKFRQIVLEVHSLLDLENPSFRAKVKKVFHNLNERFILGHVHANNYAPMGAVGGFPFVSVLELSYIRSDICDYEGSTESFPQQLDCSNNPDRPDYMLWFFPFIPAQQSLDKLYLLSLSSRSAAASEVCSANFVGKVTSCDATLAGVLAQLSLLRGGEETKLRDAT